MRFPPSTLTRLACLATGLVPAQLGAQIIMTHQFENRSNATWVVRLEPGENDGEELPKPSGSKSKAKGRAKASGAADNPRLLYASLEVMRSGRRFGIVKVPGEEVKLPRGSYDFLYHMPENKSVTRGSDSLAMSLSFQDPGGNVMPYTATVLNVGDKTLRAVSTLKGLGGAAFSFEPTDKERDLKRIKQEVDQDLKGNWFLSQMLQPILQGAEFLRLGRHEDRNSMGRIVIKP